MATISSMFKERAAGPYSKPSKAKVLATKEADEYKGKDGSSKTSLTSVVSDGETLARVVCYDPTKYPKFKVGTTVLFREIIRRNEVVPVIVVTKVSKVLIPAPIDVAEEHLSKAMLILNPPPAEKVPISAALGSPPSKKSSVEGKIIQEDVSRTVVVRGDDVKIKTITVEDKSGKAKVSLWRAAADTKARPGDYVLITDVIINNYNNNLTLTTTGSSKVEPCDAPVVKRTVCVEAVGVEDGIAELFTGEDDTLRVCAELLQQSLSGEEPVDIEMLTVNGPVTFVVTSKGNEIVTIEKA